MTMQTAPLVEVPYDAATLWHCNCGGLLYGDGTQHEQWCKVLTLINAMPTADPIARMRRGDSLIADRPPATWDGERLTVRASQMLACRRLLTLYARGESESDPPGEVAIMRMEVGKALEGVVIQAMRRAGWQTTSYANRRASQGGRPIVEVDLTDGITVQGTPDGRVKVAGKHAVLEVKTHGGGRYRRWEKLRVPGMNRPALAQAGVYRMGLVEGGEVAPTAPVVFAVLDTDTRQWGVDVIPADHADQEVISATDRLLEVRQALQSDELPPPDYAPGAPECRRCPMVTACGNGGAPPPEWRAEDDDAFEQLTLRFQQARDAGEGDDVLRPLRKGLTDYLRRMEVKRQGPVTLVRRDNVKVNYARLGELLTPDQYAEVITTSETWTAIVAQEV